MDDYEDVERIESLTVVAVAGEGVYVAAEDGRCWPVASVSMLEAQGGQLYEWYLDAIDES